MPSGAGNADERPAEASRFPNVLFIAIDDINRKGAAECIDLFRLPVDGDKNNMNRVIADAGFDDEVGHLAGGKRAPAGPSLSVWQD